MILGCIGALCMGFGIPAYAIVFGDIMSVSPFVVLMTTIVRLHVRRRKFCSLGPFLL